MSATKTTIRNWQGEVPDGVWLCDLCDAEMTSLEDAASHAERACREFVWLFPPGALTPATEALFEVHPSDWDGVYLSPTYKRQYTYERHLEVKRRKQEWHKRLNRA